MQVQFYYLPSLTFRPMNNELHNDVKNLIAGFDTVLMATSGADGEPEISYSPYAIVEAQLYVFLSDLAMHTGNLKANPRASLLFIENEQDAEKLHARKRVTFRATAQLLDRNSDQFRSAMTAMEARFGEIMPLLESLPDFHLFAMRTDSATLVRGFADAHTIECDGFPQS